MPNDVGVLGFKMDSILTTLLSLATHSASRCSVAILTLLPLYIS
jgi:hypothetical protein